MDQQKCPKIPSKESVYVASGIITNFLNIKIQQKTGRNSMDQQKCPKIPSKESVYVASGIITNFLNIKIQE